MNPTIFSWMRQAMFVAGLFCGLVELAGRGGEPNPPAPTQGPLAQAAAPIPPAWNANGGGHIERLLEDLSPPRPMMWDDRVLYELRLRLAANEDAARRRQQQNQPRPNQGRATYGDLAPLVLVPRHAEPSQDGGPGVYRPEIERLDALITQGRASAADFFLHGLIYYESGNFRIALRDFDQAILLSGNQGDKFLSLRGLAHYGLGEYREAWDDLNKAVGRSPDVRNLNNRGVVASVLGKRDLAIKDFEAALAIPQTVINRSPVFINRTLAMSDLGRHEQAVADIKTFIGTSGDPDAVSPAQSTLGFVYRRMGDFSRSGMAYDFVIQKKQMEEVIHAGPDNPSSGDETAVDALIGRGIAHHELNQIVPAIDDYNKAIRLCPKRTAAYVNRAVAYMDRGDLDLADRDLEAALKLNPTDAFAFGNRGLLRFRQGRADLGQADLARCLGLCKDLHPILERILARAQQSHAAVEHLRPSPFVTVPRRTSQPASTAATEPPTEPQTMKKQPSTNAVKGPTVNNAGGDVPQR